MDYEKNIEIPFGAKDSELKGWEYTIPEGMEAIIKDGKVLVKEKGSEDERIRRQLINVCNDYLNGDYSAKPCLNDIKWLKNLLEKQKEPKPEWSEEDENYYDTIVRKLEVIGDDSGLSDNQIKFLREHYPPHCSEWSDEDEKMLHGIEQCVYDNVANIGTVNKVKYIDFLSSLRPSWKPSEEQMEALNYAIAEWDGGKKLEGLYALRNDLKKLM